MKTSVNIKMDEEVRDQAKALFAKMGLDMTTAVNMFLITSIREKGIPFQVTSVSQSDDKTRYEEFFAKKLRAAEEEERAGQMRSFDTFMNEVDKKYGRK
jgi:addiction module RelB/DinJ family antitoxin